MYRRQDPEPILASKLCAGLSSSIEMQPSDPEPSVPRTTESAAGAEVLLGAEEVQLGRAIALDRGSQAARRQHVCHPETRWRSRQQDLLLCGQPGRIGADFLFLDYLSRYFRFFCFFRFY